MNDTTKQVIDAMHKMISALEDESKTPEEVERQFVRSISKQQLEYCLIDTELDSDDITACQEILKRLYNYKRVIS